MMLRLLVFILSPKSGSQSNLEYIVAEIREDCAVLFGVQLSGKVLCPCDVNSKRKQLFVDRALKYDIPFTFWKLICAYENSLFFITDRKHDFVRRFVM